MEYSIDSLEDLQRKIAHIENELSDISNQIALIIAKSNKKGGIRHDSGN
jgi:hypothetical protein